MPIDPRMEAHIRPRFVELLRLTSSEEQDEVARRFFARIEARAKDKGSGYRVTRHEFWNQFAIKIEEYSNFYAEIGGTPAIRGAHFPSKKIRPIFTIQRSRSGLTWKVVPKVCSGFFSQDMSRAWVPVDEFEAMLGDTFYNEIAEQAKIVDDKKDTVAPTPPSRVVEVRDWVKK